ncbi:MAG: hypothetical protein ABI597_12765 [Gammaproteobacteria bacterium]
MSAFFAPANLSKFALGASVLLLEFIPTAALDNAGTIAAGVGGGIAGLLLIGAAICCCLSADRAAQEGNYIEAGARAYVGLELMEAGVGCCEQSCRR